jgi:tetratricopeptide (TPR) repeat protein
MNRVLVFVLPVAFLVLVGNAYCAAVNIDQAWIYYLKGDYNGAVNTCRKIAGQKALGGHGRYLMGLAFLKLDKGEEARKNFEFALSNYPGSSLRQELLLGIADSYFLEGEFNKAEQAYNSIFKSYPASDYASIIYMKRGLAQRRQGKWVEAKGSFGRVIQEYPLSLEAGQARIFYEKSPFFTIQAGAFAKKENALRFAGSIKRKGYNAAVGRENVGGRVLYKIKIGRFAKLSLAEEGLRRLEKDGFSGRIIN